MVAASDSDPAAAGRPPIRPRASGDGWVEDGEGRRFWGLFGAAGLLLHHPDAGVLLQHRALWSHFGGTWGIPGGARHEHESPQVAATREAGEEAGVPSADVDYRFCSVVDLGVWSYTTVVAEATAYFTPVISDPESLELRWVPVAEVAELELHPGFAASWPRLAPHLGRALTVVVDGANVVGSRPDGWWRDRAAAADRLADRLLRWSEHGVTAPELDLAHDLWFPRIELVLEGAARGAEVQSGPGVSVVRAERDGDSAIVDRVATLAAGGAAADPRNDPPVLVITADRELGDRVRALGARVLSPGWLWERLDAVSGE